MIIKLLELSDTSMKWMTPLIRYEQCYQPSELGAFGCEKKAAAQIHGKGAHYRKNLSLNPI